MNQPARVLLALSGLCLVLVSVISAAPAPAPLRQSECDVAVDLSALTLPLYADNTVDFNYQSNSNSGTHSGVTLDLHGQVSRDNAYLGTVMGYGDLTGYVLSAITFNAAKTYVAYLDVDEVWLGTNDSWGSTNFYAFGFALGQATATGVYSYTFAGSSPPATQRRFYLRAEQANLAAVDTVELRFLANFYIVEAGCVPPTATPTPTQTPTQTPTPTPTPIFTPTPTPGCAYNTTSCPAQWECNGQCVTGDLICSQDATCPACTGDDVPWRCSDGSCICAPAGSAPGISTPTPTPPVTVTPYDPCAGVTCPGGMTCHEGKCIASSCNTVNCDDSGCFCDVLPSECSGGNCISMAAITSGCEPIPIYVNYPPSVDNWPDLVTNNANYNLVNGYYSVDLNLQTRNLSPSEYGLVPRIQWKDDLRISLPGSTVFWLWGTRSCGDTCYDENIYDFDINNYAWDGTPISRTFTLPYPSSINFSGRFYATGTEPGADSHASLSAHVNLVALPPGCVPDIPGYTTPPEPPLCYGQEVRAFPLDIPPGQTWNVNTPVLYDYFKARFVVAIPPHAGRRFTAGVNGYAGNYVLNGDAYYANYDVVLPVTTGGTGGPVAWISMKNDSTDMLHLSSVCLEEVQRDTVCLNDDAEMNYGDLWLQSGNPSFSQGSAFLAPGDTVYQLIPLDRGQYAVVHEVGAQDATLGQVTMPVLGLTAGGDNTGEYISLGTGGVDWGMQRLSFPFSVYDNGSMIAVSLAASSQNSAQSSIKLSRVCVQQVGSNPAGTETPTPIPTPIVAPETPVPTGCQNTDAGLDDPSSWTANFGATWGTGMVRLPVNGAVTRGQTLADGEYEVSVYGRALAAGAVVAVGYGTVQHPQGVASARITLDTAWNTRYGTFTVNGQYPVLLLRAPADGAGTVDVSWVCVRAKGGTQTCANPDSGFDLPGEWQTSFASIGSGEAVLQQGGWVQRQTTLPAGYYSVRLKAATSDDIGVCLDVGNTSHADEKCFNVPSDGGWHDELNWATTPALPANFLIKVAGVQNQPWARAPQATKQVRLDYLCFTYLGATPEATATPRPTPLPEQPTFTPTPTEPAPTGCLNADPGLDRHNDPWLVIGNGTLANSHALLSPSAQLVANIPFEQDKAYTVDVVWRGVTGDAQGTVYWRGGGQDGYVGTSWRPQQFLFTPASSAAIMAKSLSSLLTDPYAPELFVSPLQTPQAFSLSPLMTPAPPKQLAAYQAALQSPTTFSIRAYDYNSSQLEIQSVCIKDTAWTPPPSEVDIELYHPVCDRDYSIQRRYTNNILSRFEAMLVGPGKPGMPVHAVHGGTILDTAASFTFGDITASGCVLIDHTEIFNVPLQSVTCGLGTQNLPTSNQIARGALLGYTSTEAWQTGLVQRQGLVMVALKLQDAWVNPNDYYVGYVDCRAYEVQIEPVERCAADDGNGSIPPRVNPPAPALWEVYEWVPWLAQRLYDTVGYPILCALIPIINSIISIIVQGVNALLTALAPILLLLYRLGRLFEFVLATLVRLLAELWKLLNALLDLNLCLRDIMAYFLAAFNQATQANIPISDDPTDMFGYSLRVAIHIINQTPLAWALNIVVTLLVAYASWELVPWGLRKLRQAIGMGEG